MSEVVIVGAGQAGSRAALSLREKGFSGWITLLGTETSAPYERPALSKSYLSGESAFGKLVCLTPEEATRQRITLRMGVSASSIERENRKVVLSSGARLAYDHLILASGGSARTLPGVPIDRVKTHVIRSREDADALRVALGQARTLLVIGGGWLGLEVAATARKQGLEVHVIEAADRLCARAAPPELSSFLADMHAAQGVKLHLGQGVAAFTRKDSGVGATLADGREISADIALFALGLVPDVALAAEAGLPAVEGIETDGQARTLDPAIFAIGDCASSPHGVCGAHIRLESWQNANLSAARAAAAITGQAPPPDEALWFWSDQFGHNIQMLGTMPPDARRITRSPQVTLFLREDRLMGMLAVDSPREIAQARALVLKAAPLDAALAADAGTPLRAAVRA